MKRSVLFAGPRPSARIPQPFTTALILAALLPLVPAIGLSAGPSATASPASTVVADRTDDADSSTVIDPWEPFNRRMHGFNQGLDRYLAKPLARGYTTVVPRPIRSGVGNFFVNLFQPLTAAHQLLQGKPGQAGTTVGRFLLNATLGLGGILDPASHAGIPLRQEDLGQTLAVWGWRDSRYLVLPFLGPSTTRDGLGTAGDGFASPYQVFDDKDVRLGLRALQLIDLRAGLLGAEAFVRDVDDEYLIFRDAYLQRRRFQIDDGRDRSPDYLLDLYEFDDDFDNGGGDGDDD